MSLRHKLKPSAPAWLHLTLAAVMWTVVGSTLGYFGVRWALEWDSPWTAVLLGVAAAVGIVKALFIFRKSANKVITRIRERGDGHCLGGFISWSTWGLVLFMILLGRVLRAGIIPKSTVGFIYAGVGIALLTGSLFLWNAFRTGAWRAETSSAPTSLPA